MLDCFIYIYKFIIIIFLNIALRFVKTKFVIAFAKRVRLDVRYAWGYERLHFLTAKGGVIYKLGKLHAYYILTPTDRGVAWGCAMESTFRIINLIYFCRKYELKINAVDTYIEEELDFIKNNLEIHSINNHISFNYAGLVMASVYLNKPTKMYVDELSLILARQFNMDGSNFEASTSYHVLMIEMLCWLKEFTPKSFDEIAGQINLYGALEFMRFITYKEGLHLIGDNDDSVCIKEINFKALQPKRVAYKENREIQLDNIHFTLPYQNIDKKPVFECFGASTLICDDIELILWNPKPGQNGKCGHNHNDMLSISLLVDGSLFILDSGVPFYSVLRDEYRSATKHSCIVSVNEPEVFTGAFSSESKSIRSIKNRADTIIADISYQDQMIRRDIVLLKGKGFRVHDSSSKVSNLLYSQLILHPLVDAVKENDWTLRLTRLDTLDSIIIVVDKGNDIVISNTHISERYGALKKTKLIKIIVKTEELKWYILKK